MPRWLLLLLALLYAAEPVLAEDDDVPCRGMVVALAGLPVIQRCRKRLRDEAPVRRTRALQPDPHSVVESSTFGVE